MLLFSHGVLHYTQYNMDDRLPINNTTAKTQTATAKAQNQQSAQKLTADDKKQTYQVQQASGLKEQKEAFPAGFTEGIKVVEKKEFEPSKEVASWMEKVEGEEIELPQPIEDQYGQILLEAARTSKPKIVLPISKKKVKKGLHHKVADSIRWLAEWCLRLLKMFPERVVYKKISNVKTQN